MYIMNFDIPNTCFPQQVSVEQAAEDKSDIAFSNGASFSPLNVESVSSNNYQQLKRRHVTSGQSLENAPGTNVVATNLHRPTNPSRHPEYTDYSQRLRSYARWTLRNPDSVRLSEAGFFFTNQYDLVRCFQCGIGLKDFSEGDNPLMEHVRHSPNCQFLAEYLGTERLSAIKIKCQTLQPTQQLITNTDSNLQYRHPEYKTMQARLSSFAGWPGHMIQTPLQLAEAGLYYTGFEDQVRCFMCDGGLRRWDPEDVPWTEHCRWFPDCPFVREMKGEEFVALVQASANYTSGENENSTNEQQVLDGQDITNTMEQMSLRDPVFKAALQEHKDICLEMGFQRTDINDAAKELIKMGNVKPTIDELLDTIEVRKERQLRENALAMKHNETPFEENQRLKSLIICMTCGKNNVNVLFLPCTHHRLCMECAEPMTKCPVCKIFIRQKIRTYLA
ncbi:baculoviral IAP repeat-containing protein 8-like [Mercenaria mercenaria]|uniref:baculoviral IAP repeat-containing protein 8-like n=1 Tax=Mercenaria mercenaria TaxID=6596 RepID=UPI00234EC905|nr:baculoviral IAP repeat-containing protein 8-like [Mercenaria mercenaria]XP_053396576.1 baculoviral IAP repeat-containing protein 8-like [Mercenaria mercenaria]XP_053396577.1 baculoviral IAP repeat-containing protein 8-like [Mercenaria mercenaria]XP_053396578.1 baculoviral IAP repeat-containing protein 8-like [Mercenaria mercenaria]